MSGRWSLISFDCLFLRRRFPDFPLFTLPLSVLPFRTCLQKALTPAQVNTADRDLNTALHLAVLRDQLDGVPVIDLLVKKGANIHSKNAQLQTPAELAAASKVLASDPQVRPLSWLPPSLPRSRLPRSQRAIAKGEEKSTPPRRECRATVPPSSSCRQLSLTITLSSLALSFLIVQIIKRLLSTSGGVRSTADYSSAVLQAAKAYKSPSVMYVHACACQAVARARASNGNERNKGKRQFHSGSWRCAFPAPARVRVVCGRGACMLDVRCLQANVHRVPAAAHARPQILRAQGHV